MSARCTGDCGGQHPETTEDDKRRMVAVLYGAGFGYHSIADLTGLSHEEVRDMLIRNWRAAP